MADIPDPLLLRFEQWASDLLLRNQEEDLPISPLDGWEDWADRVADILEADMGSAETFRDWKAWAIELQRAVGDVI